VLSIEKSRVRSLFLSKIPKKWLKASLKRVKFSYVNMLLPNSYIFFRRKEIAILFITYLIINNYEKMAQVICKRNYNGNERKTSS